MSLYGDRCGPSRSKRPRAKSRRTRRLEGGAPEEVAKAVVSEDAPPGTSVDHRIGVSLPEIASGTESLLTLRWSGMDSNVQFRAR